MTRIPAGSVAKCESILVVDDSSAARAMMRLELEREGYQVAEAENGEQALTLLSNSSFDLITVDVDMPVMNGFDLCHQITSKGLNQNGDYQAPIVFVTANDDFEGRVRGFNVGASDFIGKKDLRGGELALVVNRHLRPESILAGYQVMLAEGSANAQKILRAFLVSMGAKVDLAGDVKEATKLLQDLDHDYGLVLLDSQLSGGSSLDLCRRLRREHGMRHTPIIFMMDDSKRQGQLRIFQAGATDFVTKPFLHEELVARIRVHLESERRRQRLERVSNDLERSNQALHNFASCAAHDLRSPLVTIKMCSELLVDSLGDDASDVAQESAIRMQRSVLRMTRMIEGLLQYARTQRLQEDLEVVELRDIVADVLEDLSSSIKDSSARIVVGALPRMMGNGVSLRQLFQNLLANSIKYRKPDVLPEIEVDARRTSEGDIEISVKDNGQGFDVEESDRLFDLFHSLSPDAGDGSCGIGLATCKLIAEEHGGQISAVSESGVGSTFTIRFPATVVVSEPPVRNVSTESDVFYGKELH